MPQTNRVGCGLKYIIALLTLLLLTSGCFPLKKRIKMASEECAPANLTVRPGDRTLFLEWDTNCPEGALLSGYNIYLEEKPTYEKYHEIVPPKKIKPYNRTPYPGDTDPQSHFETMVIDNLDNGTEYFVTVRTVFPDRTVSVSSNEIGVMCRPEGEFDLAFRFSDLNDGFSFAQGRFVRADAVENDLYFFRKDGFDFIASPHRLNGFLRETRFFSLGKTENIYQYEEFQLDIPPTDKIPVLKGESYLIETEDNNYAKIRIEEITGERKERVLHIRYIYQPVKALIRF
jgi:hypothetical protein